MCNKQSECALWIHPETHFLPPRSLNNKKDIAPLTLTLDQVWVGLWRSLFSVPQNSKAATMRLNTPHFQTSMPMSAQINLLFNQHCVGWENENCIGLKLAKTLALRLALHCAGCMMSQEMRSRTQMQRLSGFFNNKIKQRTKTTPKGKNKQAYRRLEHSQTSNSHDMDTWKTTDQHRTADTRRLYRETNEGDTAGATETMIT